MLAEELLQKLQLEWKPLLRVITCILIGYANIYIQVLLSFLSSFSRDGRIRMSGGLTADDGETRKSGDGS